MVYNLGAKSDVVCICSEDTSGRCGAGASLPDTPPSNPRAAAAAAPGAQGQPQRATNWQFVRSLDLT